MACLEVFSRQRHTVLAGELLRRGEVHRNVGRSVRERNPLLEERPRVDLSVGDVAIVALKPGLERADAPVNLRRRRVDLGRSAPDRDGAVAAAFAQKTTNIRAHSFDHLGLRVRGFGVLSVEALHELAVEDSAHRLDGRELVPHEVEVIALQDARVERGLVGVVFEDVPAAELELIELGEGHELPNRHDAFFQAAP